MAVKKLSLKSVSRRGAKNGEDTLDFGPGVNVMIGEPNTGKTKWLESIDYVLGDEPSAEQMEEDDIFKLYDSISAVLAIGEESFTVERRWKEPGSLTKVYVNGASLHVKQYCDTILEKIGIPIVHYPQGNPFGARKWPELSWRSLMRHIYRREEFWTDIADKQPEIDQHACIVQFLGIAEKLFSADYGDLVSKNKRIWELQAQKDQFMSILDEISTELVGSNEMGVALTPESLAAARQKLQVHEDSLAQKRKDLLEQIRTGIQRRAEEDDEALPDTRSLTQRLVEQEARSEEVGNAISRAEMRIEEIKTHNQLLSDELAKLERASEAGAVLADLKVTHCPACDRLLENASATDGICYVCGRPTPVEQPAKATRRLDFEKEQVESEIEETKQLLATLDKDLKKLQDQLHDILEEVSQLQTKLKPVRQAAAAVLPPELFLLDVDFGRVQEKVQQLSRITTILAKRERLAEDIYRIQKELADLECAVQAKTSEADLESRGDRLRDGFATYLNRIMELQPNSWLGMSISVRIGERSFRIKVGDSNWRTKLGGTQRLYFLLAYHYALMDLARFEDSRFPGFLMVDFPAKVEDGTTIADKENFLIEPFVELLGKKELAGCQLIAAGRSFKNLQGVTRLELTKVWGD
jgi:DNA repair ATPase RecN